MARISLLLFSLALVLAIGSVLAHPPSHKKTKKTLSPPTLSKLQTFPYTEISKFVEKHVQTGPHKIEFKVLFAVCKGYTDFLGSFKFSGSELAVRSALQSKFVLLTKAFLTAQAHVGVKDGLATELGKSYTLMATDYIQLLDKIAKISAKHSFKANAKISASEKAEIEKIVISLKRAIRVYIKVSAQCSKTFVGSFDGPNGNVGGGLSGKHGFAFANQLIGLGANVANAKVGAHAKLGVGAKGQAKVGGRGFFGFGGVTPFDPAGNAANAKVGGHAKVGANGEAKLGGGGFLGFRGVSPGFGGVSPLDAAGKAHVGAHAKAGGHAKVGANGEAKLGGKGFLGFGGVFPGFRGESPFDAAGKAHVGGGSAFRPLSTPHQKKLD